MKSNLTTSIGCVKTRLAWLWMRLSAEPLIALYTTLPFILRKELGASAFQIALFAALNPVLSVFSFYWGAQLTVSKRKLLPNLMSAWFLARIPFLFFPFITNIWHFFLASAIYQIFNRAATPALMEIVKRNIPPKPRGRIFSLYYTLSVLEGVVFGLMLATLLHIHETNWPLFFFVAALIGLSALLIQIRIPLSDNRPSPTPTSNPITQPLKACLDLLKTRPDFAHFQWCFMVGGLALMVITPVRTLFSADVLSVSIGTVTVARLIFVGLGMAFSAPLWNYSMETRGIQATTYTLLILFALFPVTLFLSQFHLFFFFFAHLLYGIAQGGSHQVWHLSGTIFSGDEDSSLFSTVNVLMVGIRGMIGPFLGSILCDLFGPSPVLIAVSALALFGTWWLARKATNAPQPLGS